MPSNRIEIRPVRQFGFVALFFFGALTAFGIWRQQTVLTWIFGILAIMGGACALLPKRTVWIHRGWMQAAHGVSIVVTYSLLVLSYYLLITPVAIIRRLFGKPTIPQKPDPEALTYWRERKEPIQPLARYYKRY